MTTPPIPQNLFDCTRNSADTLYQHLRTALQDWRTPHTRVVGIASGGAWLAARLQQDWNLPRVGTISTALHRDDFAQRGFSHAVQTSLPFEIDGAHIILLDDVLHTGRTIRAAINEIFDFGRPARIQLAVLVDRGERQLPIQADFAAAHMVLPAAQSLALVRDSAGAFSFTIRNKEQP